MAKKFCKYCGSELNPETGLCPNCAGVSPQAAQRAEDIGLSDRTILSDVGDRGPYGNDGGQVQQAQGSTGGYGYNTSGDPGAAFAPGPEPDYNAGYMNGANADYASGYGEGYHAPYNETAATTKEKTGKNQTLILVLVIVIVILIGLAAFLLLMKTGVITIGKGNETEAAASDEESTVADGVHMNLMGEIELREAGNGDYYVLKMGSKREFHPYAPYDETYGSKFEADEVQLMGSHLSDYIGHRVRVDGTQRYRTESAHKLDVIMDVDSVEDLGEISTVPPTTAAPVTEAQPQVSGNSAQLKNAMKFRTGPSTSYSSMGTIPKGTWVTIVDVSGDWAQIYYNGKYGWVHGTYAFGWTANDPLPTTPASSSTRTLRNNMKLRSGPSTNYSYSAVVPKGTVVTVIRYSGSWAYVSCGYGTGWVYVPYAF